MPIRWTVSRADRLVIATVSGEAGREDFARYLAEIDAAGAMPYRKILDLSFAPLAMNAADIKALGRIVDGYGRAGPLGPLAIVANVEAMQYASTVFGESSRADRPFAIFRKLAEAQEWLDRVAPAARG